MKKNLYTFRRNCERHGQRTAISIYHCHGMLSLRRKQSHLVNIAGRPFVMVIQMPEHLYIWSRMCQVENYSLHRSVKLFRDGDGASWFGIDKFHRQI